MGRRSDPNLWLAAHDIHQAVRAIIARGGTAERQATDIHQAYLGRGWTPPSPADAPQPCKNHPSITPPCPLCRA
jgi:hypothetical protein